MIDEREEFMSNGFGQIEDELFNELQISIFDTLGGQEDVICIRDERKNEANSVQISLFEG